MLTKRQKWTRHFWLHGVYFGSMGSTLTKGTGYEDGFWDSFARDDPLTVKQTYALKSEGLEEDLAFPMSDTYIYMIYPIIHHSWWFHPTFTRQVEPVSLDGVNWAFASQAEVVGPQAWKVTPPAYLPP